MDSKKLTAVLAILLTTLFWGISFSSTKTLLAYMPPEQIAFCRLILAVLALGIIFFAGKHKRIERADLVRVLAGGFFGTVLYFIFENNGLRFTTAGTGSLIVATVPVLNVIAGTLFYGERHGYLRWAGVLLSFLGVYLIVRSGGDITLAHLRGNILVFLAACTWVVYTRINSPLTQKYSGLTLNLYQFSFGIVALGFLAIPRGFNPGIFSATVLLNLAYLGLCCSAAAYFLYLYALKHLGSATVTCYINMVPVFGVLGGAVLLKEVLGASQLLGGLVVILGVMLVTVSPAPRQKEEQEQAVA